MRSVRSWRALAALVITAVIAALAPSVAAETVPEAQVGATTTESVLPGVDPGGGTTPIAGTGAQTVPSTGQPGTGEGGVTTTPTTVQSPALPGNTAVAQPAPGGGTFTAPTSGDAAGSTDSQYDGQVDPRPDYYNGPVEYTQPSSCEDARSRTDTTVDWTEREVGGAEAYWEEIQRVTGYVPGETRPLAGYAQREEWKMLWRAEAAVNAARGALGKAQKASQQVVAAAAGGNLAQCSAALASALSAYGTSFSAQTDVILTTDYFWDLSVPEVDVPDTSIPENPIVPSYAYATGSYCEMVLDNGLLPVGPGTFDDYLGQPVVMEDEQGDEVPSANIWEPSDGIHLSPDPAVGIYDGEGEVYLTDEQEPAINVKAHVDEVDAGDPMDNGITGHNSLEYKFIDVVAIHPDGTEVRERYLPLCYPDELESGDHWWLYPGGEFSDSDVFGQLDVKAFMAMLEAGPMLGFTTDNTDHVIYSQDAPFTQIRVEVWRRQGVPVDGPEYVADANNLRAEEMTLFVSDQAPHDKGDPASSSVGMRLDERVYDDIEAWAEDGISGLMDDVLSNISDARVTNIDFDTPEVDIASSSSISTAGEVNLTAEATIDEIHLDIENTNNGKDCGWVEVGPLDVSMDASFDIASGGQAFTPDITAGNLDLGDLVVEQEAGMWGCANALVGALDDISDDLQEALGNDGDDGGGCNANLVGGILVVLSVAAGVAAGVSTGGVAASVAVGLATGLGTAALGTLPLAACISASISELSFAEALDLIWDMITADVDLEIELDPVDISAQVDAAAAAIEAFDLTADVLSSFSDVDGDGTADVSVTGEFNESCTESDCVNDVLIEDEGIVIAGGVGIESLEAQEGASLDVVYNHPETGDDLLDALDERYTSSGSPTEVSVAVGYDALNQAIAWLVHDGFIETDGTVTQTFTAEDGTTWGELTLDYSLSSTVPGIVVPEEYEVTEAETYPATVMFPNLKLDMVDTASGDEALDVYIDLELGLDVSLTDDGEIVSTLAYRDCDDWETECEDAVDITYSYTDWHRPFITFLAPDEFGGSLILLAAENPIKDELAIQMDAKLADAIPPVALADALPEDLPFDLEMLAVETYDNGLLGFATLTYSGSAA